MKSVPGYDATLCTIDAAYSAHFPPGPLLDAARSGLAQTNNPVLDYARVMNAAEGLGALADRVRLLEAAAATRPLTLSEAMSLTGARDEVLGMDSAIDMVTYHALLTDAAVRQRVLADHDPYNPDIISDYIFTLNRKADSIGEPFDRDEAIRRLKVFLHGAPYDGPGWLALARATLTGYPFTEVDLDRIAGAEPYFTNAIVYSNYSYDALKAVVEAKIPAVADKTAGGKPIDMSALSPEDRAKLDRIVNCPLVVEFRLLGAVCGANGISENDCGGFQGGPDILLKRLAEVHDSGSCKREFALTDRELGISPAKVDF